MTVIANVVPGAGELAFPDWQLISPACCDEKPVSVQSLASPPSLRAVDFAIDMMAPNSGNSFVLLHIQHIESIDPASVSEAMPANWLHEATHYASTR
jgi:hypothetical protein